MHAPDHPTHLSPHLQGRLEQALSGSSSYRSLSIDSQRTMATGLHRVLDYLTRRLPGDEHAAIEAPTVSRLKPGVRYGAVGGTTGKVGRQFGNIVKQVDFPKFVSSLVDSVFKTIINSSIQQMKAYQEMVESVAKSAEHFAQDEITDDEAKTYLKQRYPNTFSPNSPGLNLNADMDMGSMPNFQSMLGPTAPTSLSDDSSEEKARLILAAKVELARGRQQMLATMVLMGINRIVITDGSINAKVVFDVSAKDTSSSLGVNKKSGHEQTKTKDTYTAKGHTSEYDRVGKWSQGTKLNRKWSNYDWDKTSDAVETRVSTHSEQEVNKAGSEMQAKAQLTGEVRINFRSETFPLERIADAGGLTLLQDKSKPRPIMPPETAPTGAGTSTDSMAEGSRQSSGSPA